MDRAWGGRGWKQVLLISLGAGGENERVRGLGGGEGDRMTRGLRAGKE